MWLAKSSWPAFFRTAFILTVLLAGAIFWLAPRPPMGDLSEHAAQVALLRDLIAGTSPWGDLVRINWFTPYLLGYGLALLFSFALPVVAALKLTLTLAYYAFVSVCVMLRKRFQGDERLDWLFVPGFFGLSFQYGFFTFLVAAPVGLLFLLLARRFAALPTRWGAVRVLCAGAALFLSHGLVFLFAGAIGVAFMLASPHRLARRVSALVPYVLLGILCLVYFWYVRRTDPLMTIVDHRPTVDWGWGARWGWHRAFNFLLFVFASNGRDMAFFVAGLAMLTAPWLLHLRMRRHDRASWIPMLVIVAIWFLLPRTALKTDYLYERFAIFLLPAYALMFGPSEGKIPYACITTTRSALVQMALMLICCSFLGVLAVRQRRFIAESASFEEILAVMEPEQRVLGLVYDPASAVVRNPYTFHVYPVWYEVEKKGFVDFNFAYFLPQIVRFRADRFPSIVPGFDDTPEAFDWHAVNGRVYRYFFVRHLAPLPPRLFENDECRVALRKEAGEWSLYERMECR
jgi:hypothetical protein